MKQDRFAKLTHKPESWHDNQSMDSIEAWAASLLRAEHRAVVRLVTRVRTQYLAKRNFSKTTQKRLAYLLALDDLLAALATRQKG